MAQLAKARTCLIIAHFGARIEFASDGLGYFFGKEFLSLFLRFQNELKKVNNSVHVKWYRVFKRQGVAKYYFSTLG